MDKILKELLQAVTLSLAIGMSILSCNTKNLLLATLAGLLIAVYVYISNIESDN